SSSHGSSRHLRAFPTRRSSDLPERRGELIGTAMGAAVGGALFGPVVGAIADTIGTGPAFASAAVAGGLLMAVAFVVPAPREAVPDRKSTRLNSSHDQISYAVFC